MEKKLNIQSSVIPQERLSYNEWCTKFEVGRYVMKKPEVKDYHYQPTTKTYKLSFRNLMKTFF